MDLKVGGICPECGKGILRPKGMVKRESVKSPEGKPPLSESRGLECDSCGHYFRLVGVYDYIKESDSAH
jgi:hypothetical protein